MKDNHNLSGLFPIEHSDLYQFWLLEKEEILKNKYYISEQLGRDCGMDYAIWDWSMRHREQWIRGLEKDKLSS